MDGLFAVLLGLVAVRHAARLVAARRGSVGPPGDGAHLVMALGMIAMFVPAVDLLPRPVWILLFVVIASWLGAGLLRAGAAREPVPHRAHRVHLTLSMAAMGYMFLAMAPAAPAPGTALAAPASGFVLAHEHGGGGSNLIVVSIAFALYFLCHAGWSGARVVRTRERLTESGHVVMGLSMSYMFFAMMG